MPTTCRRAPAEAYSSARRGRRGTATWHVQPSADSWRIMAMSAVSEPPPSAVGWMQRMDLVRVALNVEQLLSPSPGGIGRYTAQLATLLSSVAPIDEVIPVAARHGRAAVIAVLRDAGAEGLADPAIFPLPRQAMYQAWVHLGTPPLPPRLQRVDVIHAPSVAVPPKGRPALVVTVHDAAAELFPETLTGVGRRFHVAGTAAAARRADLVIAPTQAAADEIVAHTPLRAEQLRVVHHGVAPVGIPADERGRRLAALGVGDRPYVLWVGSLEPRKGVDTLLGALMRLQKGGKEAPVVVLAGFQGWLNAGLVGADARAALGDRLVVTGPVGERDLWSLYAGALLLALPSRHEGFGLTAVEAMAAGTPVVASDLAVTREVLGPDAVLVPAGDVDAWADALAGLTADPTRLAALAAAGRRRADRYRPEAFVAATRAV